MTVYMMRTEYSVAKLPSNLNGEDKHRKKRELMGPIKVHLPPLPPMKLRV